MNLKDISKYPAGPARIFTTIFILVIVLFTLQFIITEIVRSIPIFQSKQTAQPTQQQYNQEDQELIKVARSVKKFLPDGTLHLIRSPEFTPGIIDQPKVDQVFDTNDNLLWQGKPEDIPYKYLSWARPYSQGRFIQRNLIQQQMISPEVNRSLEVPVKTKDDILQIWRYLLDKAIFIGYKNGGGRIGYIGSNGFSETKAGAKSFGILQTFLAWCPADSYSPTLLWQTTKRIYQINFEKQQVEILFDSPTQDISSMIVHIWGSYVAPNQPSQQRNTYTIDDSELKNYRPLIDCRTQDDKHHLIMQNPSQIITVTIPQEWRQWIRNYHFLTATKDGVFIEHHWTQYPLQPGPSSRDRKAVEKWHRDLNAKSKKQWIELYRIDNQDSLELVNQFGWTVPARFAQQYSYIDTGSSVQAQTKELLGTFSPPLYKLLLRMSYPYMIKLRAQQDDVLYGFIRSIGEFTPRKNFANLLLSIILTALVFMHSWPRRTSNATLVFWLVFTLLFNLVGMLTYLTLNYTPAIKCASCGKRRGLNQDNCPQCNAPLPSPKPGKLDLILST